MKSEPPSQPVPPARILVIDDDEIFGQLVARFLSNHQFAVTYVPSGADGLRAANEQLPDLVICDMDMPGMDGNAVLAQLRQDARLADISLMFLTGNSAPEQIRAGMNLGADDYLTKPLDADELLRAVKARLARALVRRQRESSPPNDGRLSLDDTILVRTSTEKKLIKVREVKSIVAYGEYSWVYWDKGSSALLRKPLKQWAVELPEQQFVRVHRQAIVNLAFLERVGKPAGGGQQVHLRDTPEPIAVSQRLAPMLNRRLKEFRH
ncbi:MAG: hypothetical protein RLY20_3563 [Verrucomicrobiota bacterium]